MDAIAVALGRILNDGAEFLIRERVLDFQAIPFITDYLPEDLLLLFGEGNVYFVDQPPLVKMEFKSQHKFVVTNLPSP